MKPLAIAVPVVLLFAGCAAYQAQHVTPAAEAARTAPAEQKGVVSFKPEPLSLQQTALLEQIDQFREDLKANGKYDCCVKPACRQCALSAGECHCREAVSANGPCCGECTQSWVEGKGDTEGVDREAVLEHLGCVRELYEKKTPEGITPPGQKKPD